MCSLNDWRLLWNSIGLVIVTLVLVSCVLPLLGDTDSSTGLVVILLVLVVYIVR